VKRQLEGGQEKEGAVRCGRKEVGQQFQEVGKGGKAAGKAGR